MSQKYKKDHFLFIDLLGAGFVFCKLAQLTSISSWPWHQVLIPFYLYIPLNWKSIRKEIKRFKNKKNKNPEPPQATGSYWGNFRGSYGDLLRARFPQRFQHQLNFLKEHFLPKLTKEDIVVDIGSAECWYAPLLALNCAHVFAYDISPNLIKEGEDLAQRNKLDNITFTKLDITQDNLYRKANHVLCLGFFSCLYENWSEQKVLRQLANMLEVGAFLCTRDLISTEATLDIDGHMFDYPHQGFDSYQIRIRSKEDYLLMLEGAGFSLVHEEATTEDVEGKPTYSACFLFQKVW